MSNNYCSLKVLGDWLKSCQKKKSHEYSSKVTKYTKYARRRNFSLPLSLPSLFTKAHNRPAGPVLKLCVHQNFVLVRRNQQQPTPEKFSDAENI